MNFTPVILLSLMMLFAHCDSKSKPDIKAFQNGDIIFHTSLSSQSKAIQAATDSKYSHVGMIYLKDSIPFVFEAIQPVQITPLDKWIKRGAGEHFVVKRLKLANRIFTPAAQQCMMEKGKKYLGRNYDLYFEWSDEKIYCSELVWKIYKECLGLELGKLQTLKEFDLSSPAVKDKMKERYGDKIPYREKVISPGAMFESDLLEEVITQ